MTIWWSVVCVIPVLLLVQNLRKPELGLRDGRLKALGSKPNAVSSQTADERKRVDAIDCSKVEAPIQKAAVVLAEMPGASIEQRSENYLYAVVKTPALRFRDDVEVYFDEAAKCLHFRSASRAGYSDMGVNRKRYKQFVRRFEQLAAA